MDHYIHAFNVVTNNSYRTLQRLWHTFHDWEYAWKKAGVSELLQAGIAEEWAMKLQQTRKIFDVETAMEALQKANITLIGRNSSEFLEAIQHIPQSPFLLYRKGAPLIQNYQHIAMVGTRKPTEYGIKITQEIAARFAENQWIVVSGLAFGIDAQAHRAAVKRQKPTIAVLASGVDVISPKYHQKLGEEILATGGTLISEYIPGSNVADYRFLERNRLISGLSKATIVIEAREKSGALITARHALEQNRDVYALVGDIYRPQLQGCLRLIADDAACPIVQLDALYRDFNLQTDKTNIQQLGTLAIEIVKLLRKEPHSVQDLSMHLQTAISEVVVALTQLELLDIVKRDLQGLWHNKIIP